MLRRAVCSAGVVLLLFVVGFALLSSQLSYAAIAEKIDRDVDKALEDLYKISPKAKELSENAKGILVFPNIFKGGFMLGAEIGEGALRVNGKTKAYYNTTGVSYGLQLGVQKYSYALFLMSDDDMAYLDRSGGWELGTAPNIVLVDTGIAAGLSTTTIQKGVYAFFFGQKGLMAGLGLQGVKITKINPPSDKE